MTAGLLLDGLLFLVVAFYVPIGAWRGGPREALLGGAILLGAATAIAWAPAWGDDVAELAGSSNATGEFLVAAGLLALVGGGLGYGAGAVAGRRPSGLESRAAGGALGLINALLLLSFLLSFLTTYLNEGWTIRTVDAGWFADALVERQSWLLLIACAEGAGLAVVGRVAARFDDDLVEREAAGERGATVGARRRLAVAPPIDPDGGKVDPATGSTEVAATLRWPDRTLRRSTRPVGPPVLTPSDRASETAAAASESGNGRGSLAPKPPAPVGGTMPREGTTVVDSWLRRAAELNAAGSDEPASREARDRAGFPFTDAALRNLLDPAQDRGRAVLPRVDPLAGLVPPVEPSSTTASEPERQPGAALDPVRRCAVCGTPAATELAECPFCGATLSPAKEG